MSKPTFIYNFVNSPYAFSLSFLKDPSIIGKNDDFQHKYNLNLDEEAVLSFYQKLTGHKATLLSLGKEEFQIKDTDDDAEISMRALATLFLTGVSVFKDKIERYLEENQSDLETHYQVSIPFTLRGLLIHMMNEVLDNTDYLGEMGNINQMLANLLNSYKEAGNYFERYLT